MLENSFARLSQGGVWREFKAALSDNPYFATALLISGCELRPVMLLLMTLSLI